MRIATGFVSLGLCLVLGMGGCGGESFDSADDDDPAGRGGDGAGNAGKPGTGGSGNPGSSGSSHAGSTGAGRGSVGGSGGTATATGGGPSAGGTGNVSGSSNTGGSGVAGGGTAGGGGEPAGGAGGQPADICQEPADPGPCEAAFERWFFNAERGICETFTYGGCEGNENNFETLEACSAACAGHGAKDPTACEYPTECVVTAARCCGGNMPPTLGDLTAVNMQRLEEFSAPCQLVDCASTIGPIPAHFGATCSSGHCQVFDVRATEFTDCEESSECYLRSGLGCCEGCSADARGFVAVRVEHAGLNELICGGGDIACDACVPIPPGDIAAQCVEGACTVVALPGGG
jgi:hypothetical protein